MEDNLILVTIMQDIIEQYNNAKQTKIVPRLNYNLILKKVYISDKQIKFMEDYINKNRR